MRNRFFSQCVPTSGFVVALLVLLLPACRNGQSDQTVPGSSDTTSVEVRLKQINDSIAASPDIPGLYRRRAELQDRRKLYPAAVADMKVAVRLDSMDAGNWLYLADLSFRALMVADAIQSFRRCLSLDPDYTDANLKFAELNLYLKAYPDAITYANAALRKDERLAKPYFIKGFVYKEMKDTAKAISSFQTVVELDPDNYDAYIQLGNIFSKRGNPIALQYFGNALRIRPRSTEAFYNRGLFLQDAGKLEPAIADYSAILKLDPAYSDAYFNLGYIELVLRNNPKSSIPYFTDAIRTNENYVEAYYNRGMAFKLTGNKEAAAKDFMHALSLFPGYKLAQERLKDMGR